MKKTMMTAAILAVAIAGTSVQAEGSKRGKDFEPIKRSEMMERAGDRFDKMDSNGDGVLTADEMRGAKKKRGDDKGRKGKKDRAKPFERMDANDDGKISAAEFKAGMSAMAEKHDKDINPERAAKHFEKMDTDGDGYLTTDELKSAKGGHAKKGKKDGWKDKKGERKEKRSDKSDS